MQEREAEWKRRLVAGLAGDEQAYRAFLADVSTYLRGWARNALARAGRSAAEAEDIVQETLIAIHTKRHTWDDTKLVGPWLHGIARHKLVDALRRRSLHDHLPVDDYAETIAAPAPEASLPQSDVIRMVATLPERQAAIVRGVFLEGKRAADLAGALAMNEGAVRVALHRALKSLASRFGGARHED